MTSSIFTLGGSPALGQYGQGFVAQDLAVPALTGYSLTRVNAGGGDGDYITITFSGAFDPTVTSLCVVLYGTVGATKVSVQWSTPAAKLDAIKTEFASAGGTTTLGTVAEMIVSKPTMTVVDYQLVQWVSGGARAGDRAQLVDPDPVPTLPAPQFTFNSTVIAYTTPTTYVRPRIVPTNAPAGAYGTDWWFYGWSTDSESPPLAGNVELGVNSFDEVSSGVFEPRMANAGDDVDPNGQNPRTNFSVFAATAAGVITEISRAARFTLAYETPTAIGAFSAPALVPDVPQSPGTPVATGGTITDSGGFRIHTFTINGNFIVSGGNLAVEALLVGGGGGGGRTRGGGGGGGGVPAIATPTLTPGTYPVVIGAGGAGLQIAGQGNDGGTTTFNGQSAVGGGGGGANITGKRPGRAGGSGGGGAGTDTADPIPAGGAATAGQGNAGGTGHQNNTVGNQAAGGGGGKGAAGAVGELNNAGDGGAGTLITFDGTSRYVGAGGGGAGGTGSTGGSGVGGNGESA